MNVDDEAKVDCILAQADILADILVPDSSPELLGAVRLPQFMLYAYRRFHPESGALPSADQKGTLARGPLRVFHVPVKRCHV